MHRQFGGPAMAWQTTQANTTFERATPASERDSFPFSETIALNSESDQSLREAVEVKSTAYLGSVSLTNERSSRILQAAHLVIADQSPFNLRNTDPRLSIRDLIQPALIVQAPHAVAEASQGSVSIPFPSRANHDAATRKAAPATADASQPITGPPPVQDAGAYRATDNVYQAGYQATTESYRGTDSYRPTESYSARPASPSVPEIVASSFNAELPIADVAPVYANGTHVDAAWGVTNEPSTLRGALNNLWPGVGSAPRKASVSFDAGMPAAKSIAGDTNNSKAMKAGDALHTGRMGSSSAKFKDANKMQMCSSLPLFDTHSMTTKFQAANVTFSKSIAPDGSRTQVQTAPDFSSMTEVWTPSASGAYLYNSVYRDELNRVRYEESVNEQGLRTIVQTGYCDKEDKKSPFIAYKMVIKPDGSRELLA